LLAAAAAGHDGGAMASKPKTPKQPWDQQKGEPPAAYARFLAYRNLGPVRTLESAYAAHSRAKKGEKKHIPGNWSVEAVKWDWRGRALAWDVSTLVSSGQETAVAVVEAVHRLATKALAALDRADLVPESWAQVLETMQALHALVSPQAIESLAAGGKRPDSTRPAGAVAGRVG
jgi:hypothetical protein